MSQPDMNDVLAQAQKMQAQLEQVQQEILASSVVGEAGNGLVKATMDGSGQVSDISIDPSVVDPDDVDGLQDLILGALQNAHQKIADLAKEKMAPFSDVLGGLG